MITKQYISQNETPASQPPQAPPHANWKDHPLVAAAVASAATLGICVLTFNEIVIPTQTAYLSNQLAALPELPKKIAKAEAKIELLEKQLTETRIELLEARNINLFAAGTAYPTGLNKVKIGDQIKTIYSVFLQSSVQHEDGFGYSVELEDSPFKSVYYDIDNQSSQGEINRITFEKFGDRPDGRASQIVLKNKLTEALGTPEYRVIRFPGSTNPAFKTDIYSWKVSPKLVVQLEIPGNGYSLYRPHKGSKNHK